MRWNNWYLFTAGVVVLTIGYFLFNPSYERSLEAKFYYTLGEYRQAEILATEAFELNPYNRMASTIMTQSQTAMKFVNYIEESKKYMQQISAIANGEGVSSAERSKVKLICEVMIDSYAKISATVVTDTALVEEAASYHEKFKKLHEKIAKKG